MGIFNTILEKLGFKKEDKPEQTATPVKPPVATTIKPPAPVGPPKPPAYSPPSHVDSRPVPEAIKDVQGSAAVRPQAPLAGKPAEPAVKPIEMVDVVSKLEKMGKDAGGDLDWKVSIVDLLKLLHIDSSLDARKELAVELGCPPELMKESRNMNIWLHKTVLQKLAENGGNIPKEMLD